MVPSAEVTGQVGGKNDFEVKAAGVLIYSKQETKNFPDFAAVSLICFFVRAFWWHFGGKAGT